MPAALVAFATAGVFQTTQELVGRVVAGVEGADVDVVAEETLALVAVATARAVRVGLGAHPDAEADVAALLALPDLYRDYLVGGAALAEPDAARARVDAAGRDRDRLARKTTFYALHLPDGQFPGAHALADKLPLWMGRVSGPGLPEPPDARLARLDPAPILTTHLRLVLAFARRTAAPAPAPEGAPIAG